MPRKKDVSDAVFSFEVIAALIAASGVTVSTRHYELMAKVDKSRTASGYEHLFRAAKARAKQIAEMGAAGQLDTAAANAITKPDTNKANGGGKQGNAGAKRGRKARSEEVADGDAEEPAGKKVKTEEVEAECEAN